MKNIEYYKNIALSDSDVLKLVEGRAKILVYSELGKYKTLDEVLEPHGAVFLLYETEPDFGHWTAIIKRDDNIIEFFDSYGGFPDTQLKYVPSQFRKISGQNYPHLSALLYESPYFLTYNEHKFQKHGNGINTCGRWCAIRIVFKDLTLKEFSKIFKHANSDDLATIITTFDLDY